MTGSTSNGGFSVDCPSSQAEAEKLLEEIRERRERQQSKTPDEQLEKLQRLRSLAMGTVDDAARVVPELLQNADDVGGNCDEATIRLTSDELVVENYDERMSAAEIKALGEFRRSTKDTLSTIGHFGIGFKSVFSVTDCPHIKSGYVSLKYQKNNTAEPVPAYEDFDTEFPGTQVRLPFPESLSDTRLNEIRSKLDSINRLMPFLNNLRTITIEHEGHATEYTRTVESDDIVTVRKQKPGNDTAASTWRYRLFNQSLGADSELARTLAEERDLPMKNFKNQDLDLTVSLAVPINEEGHPISHNDSRLFCYFPAGRETNLPFDVQADFLLKPDREQIRPGHEVNEKFLRIAGSLIKQVVHTFQAEGVPSEELLRLIPDASEDRPDHLTPLTDEAFDELSTLEFIPVESGGHRPPSDLLVIPAPLRKVIPLTDFCAEYDTRDVAHPIADLDSRFYDRLAALDSTTTLSVAETLTAMAEMSLLEAFDESDIVELLAATEDYLSDCDTYKQRFKETVAAIESLPVFLFQGADEKPDRRSLSTVTADHVYRPTRQDNSVYEAFYDDLTLLDGSLLSELKSDDVSRMTAGRVRNLLSDRLDIEQIEHEDIVQEVIAEAFQTPDAYAPETLDGYIEYLRDHARSHVEAANVKLRSSDGEYRPPEELYLPTCYLEDRYESTLVLGTLTDRAPVNEAYLDQNPDTEAWREFFASLGTITHIPVSPDINTNKTTRRTFQTRQQIEDYLNEYDDDDTHVRPDRDTVPYSGRNDQYRWMKRDDAQHGLVDYRLPADVKSRFADAVETTPELGTEFIKMLDVYWEVTDVPGRWDDQEWDGTYQNCMFQDYCWSVPSNGYKINVEKSECPTSFLQHLRETEWLTARDDGQFRPRHLFVPNSVTERADVTLLPDAIAELSSELLTALNVSRDVGLPEHCNGIEQIVADRDEYEPAEVDRKVRSHLHSVADQVDGAAEHKRTKLIDRLDDCPFIYVPDATTEFRTLDQVAWADGLGDHIVAIDDHYRGFKDLFVDVLEIDLEPTLETYIDYLGQATATGWHTVEDAWKEVVRRVGHQDPPNHNLEEIATLLAERGAVPTAGETLVPYADIQYVARDRSVADRLPSDLAEQVALPWYDKRFDRAEAVDRLTTVLAATRLDDELDRTVIEPEYQGTSETLDQWFGGPLNVGYSVLADRDLTESQEQLRKIAEYSVQETTDIRCRYELDGESVVVNEPVYIDKKNAHVYVADDDAVELDLVTALAAALKLDTPRNKFVELVQGAVGKNQSLVKAYRDSHGLPHEHIETASGPDREGPPTTNRQGDGADSNKKTNSDEESTTSARFDDVGDSSRTNNDAEASGKSYSDDNSQGLVDHSREPKEATADTDAPSSRKSVNKTDTRSEILASGRATGSGGGDRSNMGGDGTDSHSSGHHGEQFILDHLQTLFETELDDAEFDNLAESRHRVAYQVSGYYDGRSATITVVKVPDNDTPHADIRIDGALLTRDGDEFAVTNVADDERTLVEVKSSGGTNNQFKITSAEYQEFQQTKEYLIARPVKVGSDDARLETIFDSLPRLHIDDCDRVNFSRLDYNGIWFSY